MFKVTVQEYDVLDNYIHILKYAGIKLVKIANYITTEPISGSDGPIMAGMVRFVMTASIGKVIYEWEKKYVMKAGDSHSTEKIKLKSLMELSGFVVTDGIWLQKEVEELLSERSLFGEKL